MNLEKLWTLDLEKCVGVELKTIDDILTGNGFCKWTQKIIKPGKPVHLIEQNHIILARMLCLMKDG